MWHYSDKSFEILLHEAVVNFRESLGWIQYGIAKSKFRNKGERNYLAHLSLRI